MATQSHKNKIMFSSATSIKKKIKKIEGIKVIERSFVFYIRVCPPGRCLQTLVQPAVRSLVQSDLLADWVTGDLPRHSISKFPVLWQRKHLFLDLTSLSLGLEVAVLKVLVARRVSIFQQFHSAVAPANLDFTTICHLGCLIHGNAELSDTVSTWVFNLFVFFFIIIIAKVPRGKFVGSSASFI